MNPFVFVTKVKTQQEKDKLIAEAKARWDAIPGEHSHLIAESEDHYLAAVEASIEIERPEIHPARPLTSEELAKQNGQLMFSQIFGDRADSDATGCAALDDLSKANRDAAFQKLVGSGQRPESQLEKMIRAAIEKAMDRNVPRRESERTAILPKMAAETEGDNSNVARFIRAYVDNDEQTMRGIARELVAA
jgi:hypothetical protein